MLLLTFFYDECIKNLRFLQKLDETSFQMTASDHVRVVLESVSTKLTGNTPAVKFRLKNIFR